MRRARRAMLFFTSTLYFCCLWKRTSNGLWWLNGLKWRWKLNLDFNQEPFTTNTTATAAVVITSNSNNGGISNQNSTSTSNSGTECLKRVSICPPSTVQVLFFTIFNIDVWHSTINTAIHNYLPFSISVCKCAHELQCYRQSAHNRQVIERIKSSIEWMKLNIHIHRCISCWTLFYISHFVRFGTVAVVHSAHEIYMMTVFMHLLIHIFDGNRVHLDA